VHHASGAAKRSRREPERIVLDQLLASIEKEAILRALARADGNKSEAAQLLGMTRPRLYRRLVQLGLAGDDGDDLHQEQPEFIERDPTE
jgi:DNA-binding NtrC family response regulator